LYVFDLEIYAQPINTFFAKFKMIEL